MSYRERRERRAERLREWAEKRAQRAAASFKAAHDGIAGIPAGQPILVGHHSEKRHRRDLARHDARMRAGIESEQKAATMTSRASEIERQLDTSIYSDDADAIERLREKLEALEAERERIKAINAAIRKRGLAACGVELSEQEKRELLSIAQHQPYYEPEKNGYPAYKLQNLGGNITRTRKRIAELSGGTSPVAPAAASSAATATERAGLVVSAGMTTPSRPGKQPRPVWTVRGNLAEWRPLLTRLGGSWYRGAFSFWEDPSAEIEAACLESEPSAPVHCPQCASERGVAVPADCPHVERGE